MHASIESPEGADEKSGTRKNPRTHTALPVRFAKIMASRDCNRSRSSCSGEIERQICIIFLAVVRSWHLSLAPLSVQNK